MNKKENIIEIAMDNANLKPFLTHYANFFQVYDFAIAIIDNRAVGLQEQFLKINQPYRIKEGRVVICEKGEVDLTFNLLPMKVKAGNVAIIPKDALIEFKHISDDFETKFIAYNDRNSDFFKDSATVFDVYFRNKIIITTPEKEDKKQLMQMFELIWQTAHTEPLRKNTLKHLIKAFLHDILYIDNVQQAKNLNRHISRSEEIFQNFIFLVSQHCKESRQVNYYADKLCLTPKYLSSVITKQSGKSIMQWINEAVILEAKILLRYSNLAIFQVADELNFPNPSFFTKFFLRMTGMTPKEFRNKKE